MSESKRIYIKMPELQSKRSANKTAVQIKAQNSGDSDNNDNKENKGGKVDNLVLSTPQKDNQKSFLVKDKSNGGCFYNSSIKEKLDLMRSELKKGFNESSSKKNDEFKQRISQIYVNKNNNLEIKDKNRFMRADLNPIKFKIKNFEVRAENRGDNNMAKSTTFEELSSMINNFKIKHGN